MMTFQVLMNKQTVARIVRIFIRCKNHKLNNNKYN